jgi:hypothetical protein
VLISLAEKAMDGTNVLLLVRDSLPEHYRYQDDGCELASSCLNCPFPCCVYEIPRGKQAFIKGQRDSEIAKLFLEGNRNVPELARHFAVSVRTVQRVLQRHQVKVLV